jgi:hypothetical protein
MFMIKTLSTMMENDYTSMEITEKATYNFASLAQRRSALSATVQPHPPAPILPQKKRPQPTKSGVGISFWFGTLAEFRFRLSNYSPQLFNSTPHEDV